MGSQEEVDGCRVAEEHALKGTDKVLENFAELIGPTMGPALEPETLSTSGSNTLRDFTVVEVSFLSCWPVAALIPLLEDSSDCKEDLERERTLPTMFWPRFFIFRVKMNSGDRISS
mmetsp:Transcript_103481/g.179668  ORF Transcript_103481/g.179668 Transcript_103481/m.179668 type:complete len:116 (+) Transcript_103481:330-677(+)